MSYELPMRGIPPEAGDSWRVSQMPLSDDERFVTLSAKPFAEDGRSHSKRGIQDGSQSARETGVIRGD